jgi:hypothetical protein
LRKAKSAHRYWIGTLGTLGDAINADYAGRATFNDKRTIETRKAGYVAQVTAERDRAKFPRKRKSRK